MEKKRHKKSIQLNDTMDNELSVEMSSYYLYVTDIISDIEDFDIWYEKCSGKSFPSEWYRFIKTSNMRVG